MKSREEKVVQVHKLLTTENLKESHITKQLVQPTLLLIKSTNKNKVHSSNSRVPFKIFDPCQRTPQYNNESESMEDE